MTAPHSWGAPSWPVFPVKLPVWSEAIEGLGQLGACEAGGGVGKLGACEAIGGMGQLGVAAPSLAPHPSNGEAIDGVRKLVGELLLGLVSCKLAN